MKSRIYLDYNSTSPFSNRLKSYLGKGDFPFANPSSMHESGKQARKLINQASSFIFQTFGLSEKSFQLVYNSGSTESIRTFFGSANSGDGIFYCESDHAAVTSTVKEMAARGFHCESLAIDQDGNLLLEQAIEKINSFKKKTGKEAYLNYLVLHNETGVYWPLKDARTIKEATGAKIHVDATQLPGKIKNWRELSEGVDVYTFSGHKFGSLKGIGFSFVGKDFGYRPLFKGGGQQGGIRGGTENALGIQSIKLALEDVMETDLDALERLRDDLEEITLRREDVVVAGGNSSFGRGVNTLNFLLKNKKADISLIQFDLAGLEVSSGSACSAGSVEPSATLVEMGFSELAKNGIRISLGPENLEAAEEIKNRFSDVIKKL